MLASVCGEGALISYFEMISHARKKVVALKTTFLFGFILYREKILCLLNISMLYYICSVVHKTFLFFYTRPCARLHEAQRTHFSRPRARTNAGFCLS